MFVWLGLNIIFNDYLVESVSSMFIFIMTHAQGIGYDSYFITRSTRIYPIKECQGRDS